MHNFFVYILKCSDQSYYVGHTNNIEYRMSQHRNRETEYTSSRLPVEVVFVEMCSTRKDAFSLEQKLKGWSRKKKEALIAGSWEQLPALSKKIF